jgi:hypothetical protein
MQCRYYGRSVCADVFRNDGDTKEEGSDVCDKFV